MAYLLVHPKSGPAKARNPELQVSHTDGRCPGSWLPGSALAGSWIAAGLKPGTDRARGHAHERRIPCTRCPPAAEILLWELKPLLLYSALHDASGDSGEGGWEEEAEN